jgi:hypothetical protein
MADFDGDGRTDVLAAESVADDASRAANHPIDVYFGQADGTLAPPRRYPVAGDFLPAIGDFDGDGRADVAFSRRGSPGPLTVLHGACR